MTVGAFLVGVALLLFVWNVWRWLRGRGPPDDRGGNSLEWVTSSPPPHHGGAAGRTSDSNCFLTRGFQVVIKVRQCPPDDLPEASRAVTPSCIPRSCRQPVHPAPPPFAAPWRRAARSWL